jgi:hypothetical protein
MASFDNEFSVYVNYHDIGCGWITAGLLGK